MADDEGAADRPPSAQPARTVTVELRLLDGFDLARDGQSVPLPLASQRLVAFLALHHRPLLRLYVAGSLWLDMDERRSCANLRSALWQLRRRVPSAVDASVTHVRLGRAVAVDVHELVGSVRGVLDGSQATESALIDELRLGGDLLPDWYDEWLEAERELLRQLRLHAIEAEAGRALLEDRPADALDLAISALRTAPMRESLHELVIRGHLAQGNRHEAMSHHRSYSRRMAHLGLTPSAQITGLLDEATAGAPRGRTAHVRADR